MWALVPALELDTGHAEEGKEEVSGLHDGSPLDTCGGGVQMIASGTV